MLHHICAPTPRRRCGFRSYYPYSSSDIIFSFRIWRCDFRCGWKRKQPFLRQNYFPSSQVIRVRGRTVVRRMLISHSSTKFRKLCTWDEDKWPVFNLFVSSIVKLETVFEVFAWYTYVSLFIHFPYYSWPVYSYPDFIQSIKLNA